MRLSVRGEYALRAMVALGLHHGERGAGVMRIREIAKEQAIPKRFLEQILNDLKDAGVVSSRRGAQGGYTLARPPELITLAEIIRHIDGPLAPVSCVSQRFYEPCTCPDESRCGIRTIMREVRDGISRMLEGFSLAQLCARTRELQERQDGGPGHHEI
jgi:Rrf2 family protein